MTKHPDRAAADEAPTVSNTVITPADIKLNKTMTCQKPTNRLDRVAEIIPADLEDSKVQLNESDLNRVSGGTNPDFWGYELTQQKKM
jgi:hypothetical protein